MNNINKMYFPIKMIEHTTPNDRMAKTKCIVFIVPGNNIN